MEDIMEEYGVSILQMIGGVAVIIIYTQLYRKDGFMWMFLREYFASICG